MLTVLQFELRGRRPGFSGLKRRGGEYSGKCFVLALPISLFSSLAAFSPRSTIGPMLHWHSATFTGDVVKSYIPRFSGKQYLHRGLYHLNQSQFPFSLVSVGSNTKFFPYLYSKSSDWNENVGPSFPHCN